MKIRSLRWGYDGGGVACGPVSGSCMTEVCVTDGEGRNYWVIDSRYEDYEQIIVSPMPLFDVMMHMMHPDVELEHEYEKCKEVAMEIFDFMIFEPDETIEESDYRLAIRVARLAMQKYWSMPPDGKDEETARAFIGPYLGKELTDDLVPEVIYRDEDEEDPEEE